MYSLWSAGDGCVRSRVRARLAPVLVSLSSSIPCSAVLMARQSLLCYRCKQPQHFPGALSSKTGLLTARLTEPTSLTAATVSLKVLVWIQQVAESYYFYLFRQEMNLRWNNNKTKTGSALNYIRNVNGVKAARVLSFAASWFTTCLFYCTRTNIELLQLMIFLIL